MIKPNKLKKINKKRIGLILFILVFIFNLPPQYLLKTSTNTSYINGLSTIDLNQQQRVYSTNISIAGECKILLSNPSEKFSIKTIGKNIFNGTYDNGYISSDTKQNLMANKDKRYKTSKWLFVYPGQKLIISGKGVNRNVWQFKNKSGYVYTVLNSNKIQVPANMYFARVYYAIDLKGDVQIELGEMATMYEKYKESKVMNNKGKLKTYNGFTTFISDLIGKNGLRISYPSKKNTSDIFGVRWKLDELTSKCERLEGAVGLIANTTEGEAPVSNSFDNVYPWSNIKLCNINNLNITYEDNPGFSLNGTNGNVFVEIPKYYIKRYQDSTHEYIYISKEKHEGFELEAAFNEGGKTLEKIYIGIYDGYINDEGKLLSISGTYPTTNKTLSEFRDAARKNGSNNFGCIDLRSVVALQHLYLVEHADKNSSGKIGEGIQKLQYPFGTNAVLSEANSNRIVLSDSHANRYKIGQTIAISEKNVYQLEHRIITNIYKVNDKTAIEFNGTAYNVNKETTFIYNTPVKNGMCDNMLSHTGFAYGEITGNGFTSVRYRYIENSWGNVWNCLDGAISVNRVPYVSYDMKKYGSQNVSDYTKINYMLPEQTNNKYDESYSNETIKNLGFDKDNPLIGLPNQIGIGAENGNSFSDSFYCSNGIRTFRWKGTWDNGVNNRGKAGLFMLRVIYSDNTAVWHDGSRLIYKPIE